VNSITNHLEEQVKRICRRHVGTAAVVFSLALAVALGSGVGAENRQSPVATADWPLHSLDQHSTRYSPLSEIDSSNADRLVLKWSVKPDFQPGALRSGTPLVIDGVMYMNGGSTLLALDADTGDELWSAEVDPAFRGGGRGPAYGDGTVYAFGPSLLYATNADTGAPVETFGDGGVLPIVRNALSFKYPDRYPPSIDPTTLGYSMTTPPTYHDGTLFVGVPFSDNVLPGGLVVAVDGTTGETRWVFNTIPQGPQDDGWEIAKDTWSQDARYGGGIWNQPAIDAELGLIFFNASNPSPNYDGSSRKGINLFTNSIIALDIDTGQLEWYFQTLHHDIWDWDLSAGPLLFDIETDGRMVKGIGSLGKNCYAYFLDRETGKPLNPIVETPVPTTTDVPGEEPWPTQPIPHTARGVPQQPFCATYPIVTDPELIDRVRPTFHPHQVNEFVIVAPGLMGGANYGAPSFSPRTGLLYATGKNDAWSIKVNPVGDTMEPGSGNQGHFAVFSEQGQTGITPTATLAAYNPVTGEQAWYAEMTGTTNSGSLATAGDIVVQGIGNGDLHVFDAASGESLFTFRVPRGISASPLSYAVNGRQLISVIATDTVFTFGLP
jgi:glucose dehydrogenase